MSESFDIVTIVFALLALFVLFKLRSVLGSRTGSERAPFDPFDRKSSDRRRESQTTSPDNVVHLPGSVPVPVSGMDTKFNNPDWKAQADTTAWNGLKEISRSDPGFDPAAFINGARAAYETIVTAFAKGDRQVLATLLAKDVYEGFANELSGRESRGESLMTTFVSIDRVFIADARLHGSMAQIALRYESKLITATMDRAKNVISGNPEKVVDVMEIWTFARDTKSTDPNWQLIGTETAH